MKCFVIMPYHEDFDDVYEAIVAAVSSAGSIDCFRLDDRAAGGRVISKIEESIKTCDFCVADLSGGRPNVMWEIGYAMALDKPVILISQHEDQLPFDIQDVLRIAYERTRLRPLRNRIQEVVRGTVTELLEGNARKQVDPNAELRAEMAAMKEMFAEVVSLLRPNTMGDRPRLLLDGRGESIADWSDSLERVPSSPTGPESDLSDGVAPWSEVVSDPMDKLFAMLASRGTVFREPNTGSVACLRRVDGQWLLPYCYGGDSRLVGLYHDFSMVREHLFGRFFWFESPISGFAFFETDVSRALVGRWWMDANQSGAKSGLIPDSATGTRISWEVQPGTLAPSWAESFFRMVESKGLEDTIRTLLRRI